jgi:hypothetical protein
MRGFQAGFCFIDLTRVFFSHALQLTKAWMVAKSVEVQQSLCVAELEEANARVRAELAAADTKVAEVERREQTLSSDYDGLRKDFNDLWTSHAAVVQEKADLEKTERGKEQQFQNLLRKKLAELRRDTRCKDFPATDVIVSNLLDWFRMEVWALPTSFVECNKNITCFALVGIFKMLMGVKCEHLSELKKLALSCNASILHDVSDDIGRIAKKLMRNWWTNHGLPYCMQKN